MCATGVALLMLPLPRCEREQLFEKRGISLFFNLKPDIEHEPDVLRKWTTALDKFDAELVVMSVTAPRYMRKFKKAKFEVVSTDPAQWDEVLYIISTYNHSKVVGFLNSDILPGPRTAQFFTIMMMYYQNPSNAADGTQQYWHPWLMTASRYDLRGTYANMHTGGGTDIWLWNNVNGSTGLFSNIEVPKFYLSRPYFDLWTNFVAMKSGYRQVLDATTSIQILHRDHARKYSTWDEETGINMDAMWKHNKEQAFKPVCDDKKCYKYRRARGTVCEFDYLFMAGEDMDWKVVRRDNPQPNSLSHCLHRIPPLHVQGML